MTCRNDVKNIIQKIEAISKLKNTKNNYPVCRIQTDIISIPVKISKQCLYMPYP